MRCQLLQRVSHRQHPPQSPLRGCSQHEGMEESIHQLRRLPSGPEPLQDSFSLKESTDSTVADLQHDVSDSSHASGRWQLGCGEQNRELSSFVFEGRSDNDGVVDKNANSASVKDEQSEAHYGLESAPHWAEMHTEHRRQCRLNQAGDKQVTGEVTLARQRVSPEPCCRTGIDIHGCSWYSAEASMSCGSRGDVSTPAESVSVALGRKEADGATANHVETDEEGEQDTSSDTPQTGLGEEYRPRFRTAAIQSFEHALQQDLLIHTSRKLMYTTSDMVLSPTVAYDGFEDVESATGLLTAQTKSVGVYDKHDGAASALIFKTLGGESGTTGALASAPLDGVLLPYRSALPASPAQDGSAFLPSATAAHAKAVPLAGLITQESTEAETSQEAHQRLPPPPPPVSVSSPSQVECVSVEMDMVTQETAEQLFRRCDHAEGTADGANSDDTAAHQSALSFLGRGYSRSSQGAEDSRIGSRRPRSPTLFPPHHIETVDTAEAHWAKSPLDGDCSVPPWCSQVGVCDTGGSDTQHGGGAMGSEAAVATRAAQTFSSTLLPPLEERRADNYELAKVLHRHGIHATLSGASRGLLASPPADRQPCDDLQCVDPRGISCAADPTSLSLADAMRSSVDMGTSSSQDTSVSPPQGAGHVPHRQDLMIPYSPVDDSRRLRGGPEGPRCCCGPSDPSVVEPSVIECLSSAAVFEGVSAAVAAVSELTVVDPSVAPSRTPPSTPRRKKPPPRMLCPPTLSPSPPRFSAMDVMIIAAPNAGTSEEDDAYAFERSLFSGVAPGAEPQSRPHIGKTNVSAEASNTMCTSMMTPAAAAAAASSATLSLCQSPLPTSSTVPVTASAVATVATSDVEGGAVVNVTSCSRSSEERALQDMRSLETERQAEGVNKEGEVTESRAATNISIADRSGDGSRQVSPCCISNGSSQPQLNYSDRSLPSPVCHPTGILQHVGAGEKLQAQLLCTTSFPQNGWSADQVSPSLLLRDHHGDTLTSRNISSSAPESIHAQIMLRSSSSASPSPIRPSTGSASDNEPLHYEAPALHSYGLSAELAGCHHEDPNNSGDDDEAHLCYDEQNSSRVGSGATTAVAVAVAVAADDGDVDSTWQSATPCGLCDDGRAGAEQACVEEIRCQAEAKTAALSLQLASATARAVAAEAKAHVRELESIHLHALVERLRSDLAVALAASERVVEKTRADVGVQIGACTDFSGGAVTAALMSSSSNLPNELSATICSEGETTTLAQDSVWRGRYVTLAHEMATLKSSMADQLAVLDRLGMRPPFSEELVGAAERRLRHVKTAHAPGTAVKANRPDATLSDTPPAPTHAPCVDNAVSLCCPARGTAVTVTTKKLQESDSNTIAALLGKRKQNNHSKQQATAEATVMGTTVSETASATLALPKNRNRSAHHGSPILPMADRNYSPFSGFTTTSRGGGARSNSSSGAMGSKLTPVNWSTKSLVPGKWKVVDASAIRKAASVKDNNGANKGKSLTDGEAEEWRQANSITVSDSDQCPNPITHFDMLTTVPQYLRAKLLDQGFKNPTPIQAQSWPIVLSGRDLVGVAKTGSGKTLAFIVPALAHIALQEPLKMGDGPMVIVLAPTRELAQQIEQETIKVLPQSIRCGCIYGGAPKGPQLGLLRQGIHILVATPGRLIDFMEIKRVNLLRVTYLVMDEADRMLDMGFEPQVRAICSQIRPDRQTLMFSATWPREIQNLASSFQKNWVRINVGSMELLANKDVTQHFILTSEGAKLDELKRLMERHRNQRVLVFCKTKKTADYLEFQLKRNGVDCMAIHGDKEQRQREFILERFRKDPRLCVVATDVAARGLDIKELETVVNYDFPMQIDDYVHRIGRTGRAGAKGASFTMITKHETQLNASTVFQLVELVERAGQEVPGWLREWAEQGGGYHAPKRNRNMMGNFGRDAPRMRMPGDNFTSGAGGGGGHFGLAPHAKGSQAFGAKSGSIQHKKFDYSSDDDDSSRPTKRARQ